LSIAEGGARNLVYRCFATQNWPNVEVRRPQNESTAPELCCSIRASAGAANGGSAAARESAMTLEGLIIFIIIGAIAGWLAGQIMKGGGFGLIGDIIVGIIGAFIAGWLLPMVHFPMIGGPIIGEIIYATIGAIILLFVIRLIKR
jgi:uncharacterized membrane protein YeaQ/YmgE (transglycosylase-associated protein family)